MSVEVQAKHIEKYKHDVAFIRFGITSGKGDFSDWGVIGSFYAAVHLVEAVFAKENITPTNDAKGGHAGRENCMREHSKLFPEDTRSTYIQLRALSEKARYRTTDITPHEARDAQNHLEELELSYRKYII